MRIIIVLLVSALSSACIQDFKAGHPHCLTRSDCLPEVLGDGFDEPRYNCENNECVASNCGDGTLDEGETCDDGNSKDDDTCSNLCAPPTCGDGLLQGEELCDEGPRNNDHRADACRSTCTPARCGDGVLDQGEICDDGNSADDDACRNTCIEGFCGDGVLWGFEQGGDEDCDDGNEDETDGCNSRCRSLYCGDGIRQGEDSSGAECGGEEAVECAGFQTCVEGLCEGWGEECDEGSSNSDELADSCRNSCRLAYCGDNVLDTGEECDDGNLSDGDGCSSGCAGEPAVCGDGNVHFSEECDDGNNFDNDSCLSDCRVAHCGDGVIRDDIEAGQPAYEECDDGNANDFDVCRNDCREARCGDGATRLDLQVGTQDACTQQNPACPPNETCNGTVCETISYESCDDGNDVHEDGCLLDCRLARCGDGVRRTDIAQGGAGYEACDDGNSVDDDECRNDCSRSSCGDGELHEGLEQCDDGNRVNDDGCTNVCTLARCGDGVVRDVGLGTGVRCNDQDPCLGEEVCNWGFCRPASYEYCDDGNDWVGDGCNAECQPPPCGDGLNQEGEACDDGNQFDWDGCSGICEVEPWPYCGTVLRSVTLRQGGDPVAMDVSGETAIVSFADGDLTWVDLSQGNVAVQSFVGRLGEGEAPDYARWIAMRPDDANFVAFGLRRGLSFRQRNGHQVAETFVYPTDGDVEAYRAGSVGGWADNNRMVFQQNQVNQLDDDGNPLLNQDGSNVTIFDSGVVTLHLDGNALRQNDARLDALRQPGQTPVPTLRAVAPSTGFYLRIEDGEQGGNRLRSYAASHALEGTLDFSPSQVAVSSADVFAAARPGGTTMLYYLNPPQGQPGGALQPLRAELQTAGSPVWMAIDSTGDYLARTVAAGGERRVMLYDTRVGAFARTLQITDEPLILAGRFTSINRLPRLVVLSADSKLSVIGCAAP